MDLIEKFDQKMWTSGDANTVEGFDIFRIGQKGKMVEKGQFKYAMFNPEGELKNYTISGVDGERDPLVGVGNVEIKLSSDGKDVIGVMVADQCVLKK